MKWRIEIGEGDLIPRGYGVGVQQINRGKTWCYPLGLNVLVALRYAVPNWLRNPRGLVFYAIRQEKTR